MRVLGIRPVVSEKAMALSEQQRTYAFLVPKQLNKPQIAQAIGEQFKVQVQAVNTANLKGKPKNALVQKGRRRLEGDRPDTKKVYVKLAAGQSIKLFEEPKSKKSSKGKK